MLQVSQLSMAFGDQFLFDDVSFQLMRGERCGLVGRNGSGKTTLLKILSGEIEPESGNVTLPKDYRLGYLNQHIRFTKPTVLEEATLGLREEDRHAVYKVEKFLSGLGFSQEDLQKDPTHLSGGYHLRLHLTKVLASEPDCLLLDEPTNYLDIVSLRWFERFLQRWRGELILITHDRDFMDQVITHTVGIHRQKVRKLEGGTAKFYEQLLLEEEVHEKTRANLEKKREKAQSFIERFGAKATKAKQASSRKKMLDRMPVLDRLNQLHHLEFAFNEAPFPGKVLLEARSLRFGYEAGRDIIRDIGLSVEKGECIAILGKNGRGKSTLLSLLAKELTPQEGLVKHREHVQIGYFGQTNIDRLHPNHSVEGEIGAANPALKLGQIRSLCGLMMFSGDLSKKAISVLSGGERARVLLGKILATPCNLLMLDEPTHHLDMESIEALIEALEAFSGAVIIVTHSELILKRLDIHKIIYCTDRSQTLFLGDYERFLEEKGWEEEVKSERPVGSKQDRKKERAELIQKRSKALQPLKKRCAELEKELNQLEKLQAQDLERVQECQGEMQDLFRVTGERQKKIEQIYDELDALTKEMAAISESFHL